MNAGAGSRVVSADRIVDSAIDWSPGWIRIDDGVITARGTGRGPADEAPQLRGTLIPGFVDLHCHGALGIDFARASTEDALHATAHHRARGTTSLIASVATGSPAETFRAVERLTPLVHQGELAGIHLEGPFLSPARRGAHAPSLLRVPDRSELDALLGLADGAIRIVTLAPELPGGLDLVEHLVSHDVLVALGHTDCDAATALTALDLGASLMTHLFNGMPPLHHREPGPVGVGLTDPRATVELIADGHHLSDEILRLALGAARDRSVLVSDAMSATGFGDGRYEIAGSSVDVREGVATLSAGQSLAGSTITILDAVRHVIDRAGVRLQEAVRLSSGTAARLLGQRPSGFAAGAPADAVLLSSGATPVSVLRNGEWL